MIYLMRILQLSMLFYDLLDFLYLYCSACQRERREYAIFKELMKLVPKLQERIIMGSEEEVIIVADLVSIISQFSCIVNM